MSKKEYVGFKAFEYILNNKDKELYNLKYGFRMKYSNVSEQIVFYDKNNSLISTLPITDEIQKMIWSNDNRKRYCFRLYKDNKLKKVITQSCPEEKINKATKMLMIKYFCDRVEYEEIIR